VTLDGAMSRMKLKSSFSYSVALIVCAPASRRSVSYIAVRWLQDAELRIDHLLLSAEAAKRFPA
jgi:hypothetical protein